MQVSRETSNFSTIINPCVVEWYYCLITGSSNENDNDGVLRHLYTQLLYKGPHDWFNLDADVKAATSKQAFRKKSLRLKFTSY